ncbi:hypothetical protein VNI00_000290 [Paramarasmius palmivorus]|uniref:Uncharacterized protein n=1 Tax=Paramarasmius palmivorus TaxID=297713 RepID=A0AAW0EGW7_9AGAR
MINQHLQLVSRTPQNSSTEDALAFSKERGRGSDDSHGPNAGAIAGGVVGGVVGLILLGALFWWYRKRRALSRARAKPKELDPEMHSDTDLPIQHQPAQMPPEATRIQPFVAPALDESAERAPSDGISPPHYLHVTNAAPSESQEGYLSAKRRSTIRSTASHLSPTTSSHLSSISSEGDRKDGDEVSRLQRQVEQLTEENKRLAMQSSPPAYEQPR